MFCNLGKFIADWRNAREASVGFVSETGSTLVFALNFVVLDLGPLRVVATPLDPGEYQSVYYLVNSFGSKFTSAGVAYNHNLVLVRIDCQDGSAAFQLEFEYGTDHAGKKHGRTGPESDSDEDEDGAGAGGACTKRTRPAADGRRRLVTSPASI